MSSPPDHPRPRGTWPRDWFAWCEIQQFSGRFLFPVLLLGLVGAFIILSWLQRTNDRSDTVIAYVAQDQVYAEPILAAFTQETGIQVRAVFDSEAVKTVALANRLLAERNRAQCDLYWGNEELRTRQLAAAGVFRRTNTWAAVGYRSRRLVINTNLVHPASAPGSLLELTNRSWSGRIAIAYPLFGTTATHLLALRQQWGEARWLNWCRALQANKPFVVDGNSAVVQFVTRGEAAIGLTDSDDIAAAQSGGAPIAPLPLTEESLLIPNTLAVINGAPHEEAAEKLFRYLQRPEVVAGLVKVKALEGSAPAEVNGRMLRPDWEALLRELDPATRALKQAFAR